MVGSRKLPLTHALTTENNELIHRTMNTTKFSAGDEERTRCLVYTRVMGYHRPVESFNTGKKGEHRQRTYFSEKA